MLRLANRVAIITGAGKGGIGEACAFRFAAEGAAVVVADIRQEAAADTAARVQELGGRALALDVDVVDRQRVRSMVERAVAAFGKVDILVNVAGGPRQLVLRPGETQLVGQNATEETTDEFWHYIIDLNLKSVFLCCQAVIPFFKRQHYGRIVNFSSFKGRPRARHSPALPTPPRRAASSP